MYHLLHRLKNVLFTLIKFLLMHNSYLQLSLLHFDFMHYLLNARDMHFATTCSSNKIVSL